MSKPSRNPNTGKPIQHKPADYDKVLFAMVELLDAARRASARVVNSLMTATYWEVGRRIVEHDQAGKERAAYGAELLILLSADLTKRFGEDSAWTIWNAHENFSSLLPPRRIRNAVADFYPRWFHANFRNGIAEISRR